MANLLDNASGTFLVLRNAEEQYSLWPEPVPAPQGWTVVHGADNFGNNNRIDNYCYDAAGNLLDDGACPASGNHKYSYDAEGRIATALNGSVVNGYGADGLRLSKQVSGQTPTDFLYFFDGSIGAHQTGSTFGLQEIWVNGQHFGIATLTGTGPVFTLSATDWVGTERIRTDAANNLQATFCSLPFGDSQSTCYGTDPSPTDTTHLIGKERDSESGNDYFGARYYASSMGRFLSPDPSRLSILPSNPQTWNRYAYVYNNPLGLKDDNGKWPTSTHNQIIDNAFPNLTPEQRQILKNVSAEQDGILNGGQSNDLAYMHAMRGPDETVEQAQGEYNDFVQNTEAAAHDLSLTWPDENGFSSATDLNPDALAAFGRALHAILDSTSPAHAGFQKWDWRNPGLVLRHHFAENKISPQQMRNAVNAARNAFNGTFDLFIGSRIQSSSAWRSGHYNSLLPSVREYYEGALKPLRHSPQQFSGKE